MDVKTQTDEQKIKPVIEPITRKFLDSLNAKGGPQLYELSVEDARNVLSTVQAVNVAKCSADVEDRTIAAGPSGRISIRIVRPQGVRDTLPATMYFHGGGWVLGGADTHDRLIREIACGTCSAVVFVNYTRSPEARYPVSIEEAYSATEWIEKNGREIGIDPARIVVAGDSVGGNMAAAVTLLAKERGGPDIMFQVLFYPVTDGTNFDTGSYRQFANGYFLTREAMKWFWKNYASEDMRSHPTASPLKAGIDQLRGLPPALIINGECDVLRDEGEAYARKLIEAGVPVTATRYLGTIHDFVMLNPIAESRATRAAIAQAIETLRNVFAAKEKLRLAA
jgi:acetyl esterase